MAVIKRYTDVNQRPKRPIRTNREDAGASTRKTHTREANRWNTVEFVLNFQKGNCPEEGPRVRELLLLIKEV